MERSVTNPPPHRYAGRGFDRAARRRKDPAWLAARRADPRTRVVLIHELKVVVSAEAEPRLHLPSLAELDLELPEDSPLLGQIDGNAIFMLTLSASHPLAARAVEVREVGPHLEDTEAGLAAYARALAYWHSTNGFCSRSGEPTQVGDGGHARRCEQSEWTVFPRTDPAVIVLVHHEDHCLLGRAHHYPANMYSTLAGFVEPGESLEDTIRREIFEEAGVVVTDMLYRSSQPWPFPASLMLGFYATAEARTLAVDADELADARWFHKDELFNPMTRPVSLPRPDSIARWLIESWLYGH